jgi:hypothetical protein
MCINKGTVIKTSYDTGPYVVEKIIGPCTCPSYLSELNQTKENPANPSKEHYHFVVKDAEGNSKSNSYLNGYHEVNGRILSVWSNDEILILGQKEEKGQLELF